MKLNKIFAMLVLALALAGAVMAESNETQNQTQDIDENHTQAQALAVRYDHLQCKVAFTNKQIDILKEYTTVDLTADKQALVSDMQELSDYVESVDKEGFDNYTESTLRPDLQKATSDLNNAKKNFRQYNLSNETKSALIQELKDAKQEYSACTDDKEVKMAKVMEVHMRNWNRQWTHVLDKMTEKNMSTTDIEAYQAQIDAKNEQLQALIESGNVTKIKDFMKAYHELQLQYAAKFEIARLKGYNEKLGPLADKYNRSDKIKDIKDKIAEIENDTHDGMNDTQFKHSWKDLKDVNKEMKDAAKMINEDRQKDHKNKERQQTEDTEESE